MSDGTWHNLKNESSTGHGNHGFRERCSDGCIGHENEIPAKLTVATATAIGQETAVSQPDAQHKPQGKTLEHLTATPRT